jgi:hypothetical protein
MREKPTSILTNFALFRLHLAIKKPLIAWKGTRQCFAERQKSYKMAAQRRVKTHKTKFLNTEASTGQTLIGKNLPHTIGMVAEE